MTPDSILVSWKAPELPNGIVNQYTVYIQEGSVINERVLNNKKDWKMKY